VTTLDHYAAEYRKVRETATRDEPAWLTRAREDALARFLALGFPGPREEEWRFTNVAPIAAETFALGVSRRGATAWGDETALRIPGAAELVFVNGVYAPELSRIGQLPRDTRVERLEVSSLSSVEGHLTRLATWDAAPFTALNTAFLIDGALVHLPPNTRLEEPLHVLFLTRPDAGGTPVVSHPRLLAVIGGGSKVSIVETYAGPDGERYFTNAVTELVVGENASVDHYKRQYEGLQAFHIASMHARAARDAAITSHSLSLGGALVRNDVIAVLDGEGADCALNGLYLADGGRLVDNHTTIDHAKPHCGSREVYKGILAGRARGVFNGKIVVRPDAQKTDAKQTNRALLLSEDAQINTKPQLQIFANDVKCTHGAAVGQLDDEAVFYLRSRGLSEPDARRLLVRAFAGEVLSHMRLEAVRSHGEAELHRQLAQAA
jgi:Fe-S cluster assembly protein SufD